MLIDALSVLCVQLTRDLLTIANFLFVLTGTLVYFPFSKGWAMGWD